MSKLEKLLQLLTQQPPGWRRASPAVPVTVRQLVKHYGGIELPNKAYSTQRTSQTSLKTWVLPK